MWNVKNALFIRNFIGVIGGVLLISGPLQSKAQPYPMSDPSNQGGWILNEYLSDEFDGNKLDKTKWWILGENGDYRNKWKGRAPGQFAPHNVRVENGMLILTSRWDPDFQFANEKNNGVYYGGTATAADKSKPITQACVMSEAYFRYGYMEIRCKAADAPVTASFWTTGYHSEIDMTENFGKRPIGNPKNKPESLERKYRTNMISWDPDRAPDHKNWKVEDELDVRVADDFFVYGFEWDSTYIRTYFNGKLIRSATRQELEANDQWRHDYPQELWLDSEVFEWYGLPSQQDLAVPAEYQIDYVRIWQKKITPPDFNALGFEGPFRFQGRSVPWWAPASTGWRMKAENVAEGAFSLRFLKTQSFSGTQTIFGPYGSLNLTAGQYELRFKLWVDPNTSLKKLNFTLTNPWMSIPVNTDTVETGKWVEVRKLFSRSAASNQSLTNGDRMQISVDGSDVNSSAPLFYIDDIRLIKSDVASGINAKQVVELNIYPNPVRSQFTLQHPGDGMIELMGVSGQKMMSLPVSGQQSNIDVSKLDAGVYVLRFNGKALFGTQKIIKREW